MRCGIRCFSRGRTNNFIVSPTFVDKSGEQKSIAHHDSDKLEKDTVLNEDEKARIRAEEEFRKAIKQELAKNDTPRTRWQQLFGFLNSNVGGWLLSTVLVGIAGVVFNWVNDIRTQDERSYAAERQKSLQDADMVTRLLPALAKGGNAPDFRLAITVISDLGQKNRQESSLYAKLEPLLKEIVETGTMPSAKLEERQAAETVASVVDASSRTKTLQLAVNAVSSSTATGSMNTVDQGDQVSIFAITETLPKRIYIQIPDKDFRDLADSLRTTFQNQGFITPKFEEVGSKSPDQTEVRYFNESDQATAEQINDKLKELGYKVSDKAKRPKLTAKSGHFEIWLAKNPK